MSERCSCCAHETAPATTGLAIGRTEALVRASDTVESVGRRSARALATMKELGINHCCGGHLTLAEAAAAAGVPLDTLLRRVGEAVEGESGQ